MATFTRAQLIVRAAPQTLAKTARAVLREEAHRFSATIGYDVFLSHSTQDAEVILGLKIVLENHGLDVYVDWIDDPELDRSRVTSATAQTLRQRMDACRALFYAHSPNATNSKWMAWELGYFDGRNGRVGIVPITAVAQENFVGQEYLSLYPYVDEATSTSGARELWVNPRGEPALIARSWLVKPS